jgi:Spy/CpxP family protein refolding chaperone
MKRKLVILGVLLLIAVNVSVLATVGYRWKCAQGGKICGGCAPGEYICLHLGLSDSQRQRMEMFRKAFDEKTDTIRESLNLKRNELMRLLNEPFPDRVKIDSLIKEIGIAQVELEKEVIDHILQEKEVLTPEQQKKLFELIQARLIDRVECEMVVPQR